MPWQLNKILDKKTEDVWIYYLESRSVQKSEAEFNGNEDNLTRSGSH